MCRNLSRRELSGTYYHNCARVGRKQAQILILVTIQASTLSLVHLHSFVSVWAELLPVHPHSLLHEQPRQRMPETTTAHARNDLAHCVDDALRVRRLFLRVIQITQVPFHGCQPHVDAVHKNRSRKILAAPISRAEKGSKMWNWHPCTTANS